MKKYLLITLLLFSVGEVFAEDKIAVVDLQQLVSNSSQVKQLKQEHSKKLAELDKIIVNARGEIANNSHFIVYRRQVPSFILDWGQF